MKMKYYLGMTALMALPFVFVSCEEEQATPTQTNYLSMTIEGSQIITEDQKDTLSVDLLLATSVKETTTLNFELQNNADTILYILNPSVTLQAGQKQAELKIISKNKSRLEEARTMPLILSSATDASIRQFDAPLVITVRPDSDIPVLTEEQENLIEGYKNRLGIDVQRFIGRLDCKVRIVQPLDEKGLFFDESEVREFSGKSVITLSKYATADTPVLVMTENPLGLESFLHEMMTKETVDNESWLAYPYAAPVLDLIAFDAQKEIFNVSLDSLVLQSDKSVGFLAERMDAYDEPITVVPFQYSYTAWDRMKAKAEEGAQFEVEEGGTTVTYSVADAIEMGTSLNPYSYLQYSTLTEDTYENEPSDWVEPKAFFDEEAGSLTFVFPWDHTSSSGYTQIQVIYTLKDKK